MTGIWRFARMAPAEINQDPVQGEFFSRTADLPGRLVREAIQNSLDARHGSETVRVRFVFSGNQGALNIARAAPYLEGLLPYVEASSVDTDMPEVGDAIEFEEEASALEGAVKCFEKPMTYLAVEDFGTKGLIGNTSANRPREEGNDFWGFFRSIGISPKGDSAGGSWGLGKWVFPDASVINSYLGITQRRHEENRWLLMGMAALRTHLLNEAKYRPYGFFALASDRSDEHWLPLPIDDDDEILEACGDFGLERIDGPGLSVIIPYPKQELKPSAIASSVCVHYFLPIARGDLVVEIVHPEEGTRTISSETILLEVDCLTPSERLAESPDSLRRAIQLAKWAITLSSDHVADVSLESPFGAVDEATLADLRQRYDQRERLAFRVNMDVRPRSGTGRQASSFHIYLERADDLSEGHDYFIRGHLHLPEIDYIRGYKARALVIVDGQSPLGHMLRDAENPAHTRWNPSAQRLRERWIGGPRRVREIQTFCASLLRSLIERPEAQQKDALADLFPGQPERGSGQTRSQRQGTGTSTRIFPPISGPSPFVMSPTAQGFSVRGDSPSETIVGSTWDLRFAYDVVRGNPLKRFDAGVRQGTPDFSLYEDHLQVECSGADVEISGHNSMRIRIAQQGFRLLVTGLDDRDIVVDLRPAQESGSGEAVDPP